MEQKPSDPVVVAAIIEQAGGQVLLVRPGPTGSGPALWEFPSGRGHQGESPEAAMRRVAREKVGLTIAIDVGQPPLAGVYQGTPAVWRYFLAGVVDGEAQPLGYAEVRWVAKTQLGECDLAPSMKPIVEWYAQ